MLVYQRVVVLQLFLGGWKIPNGVFWVVSRINTDGFHWWSICSEGRWKMGSSWGVEFSEVLVHGKQNPRNNRWEQIATSARSHSQMLKECVFCWQSIIYYINITYIYINIYIYLDDALPICSMSEIFTYIYHKFKTNLGKYSIHGAYGLLNRPEFFRWRCFSILNGSSKGLRLVRGLLSAPRFKSLASHLLPWNTQKFGYIYLAFMVQISPTPKILRKFPVEWLVLPLMALPGEKQTTRSV